MSEFYGGNSGNEVFRDYSPGPHAGLDTDPRAAVAPDHIDKRAKAAMILGLLSLVLGFVTGLPALWVGRRSLQHLAASDGDLRGRRLAIAGMVLGGVGIILTSVLWVYLHQHPHLNSAVAVANKLGCADVQQPRQVQGEGLSTVTCRLHGDPLIVTWFYSQAQENAFKHANQHIETRLGSRPSRWRTRAVNLPITVYGDRWAISCTRAAVCQAAKKSLP